MNASKRQKVPPTTSEQAQDFQQDTEKCSISEEDFQGPTLDTLPPEVLEMILRLLPLHHVATTVRLVSRHCSIIAAAVLNGAFLAAGAKLESQLSHFRRMMRSAKTAVELVTYSKALDELDLIKVQYKMLRAVTWRYTHPSVKQRKFPRLCFYGGSLLDDLNDLLGRVAKCNASIVSPRTADSSTSCFMIVCKRFMNFFEKVSERRVNRSALISGCKVVDILDCLVEGRQVLSLKITPKRRATCGTVTMKLKYVMKRAWFTCLDVAKNSEDNSWRDEQRFMYLRLRRLVGSVNEHLLENLHYEHELLLQVPLRLPTRPPPASTYLGYGEYGGRFFYYGNMNKYAYESKFSHAVNPYEAINTIETEQQVQKTPSFDLVVEIELKCSPELAPLAVRTVLKSDEFEVYNTKVDKHQRLFLRMSITCPASLPNRLPGTFVWELHNPRRV